MSTQWGPAIGPAQQAPAPVARPRRKPFFKRKQFLFAGALLAVILAYLIYVGVKSAGMYYMTVSELMAQQTTMTPGQQVRVQGKVVSDSVQQEPATNSIRFTVSDGQTSLPVVYTGVVPDSFQPDSEVVMEGTLNTSGTFQATNLMAKCASKYNPLKGG